MINLILVGDIMLGRSFNQPNSPLKKSLAYPWGDTLPILQAADLVVCNLETTLTKASEPYPKTFNFQLNPKYAKTLHLANISYCSLANNHIFDYYQKGMKETTATLRKLKIKYAGVGKQARSPVFITKNGIKFGFLSAADHYSKWEELGLWYIPIKEGISSHWKQAIKVVLETKKKCDILIFSLHWNDNYVDEIEKNFILFAHYLIDAGVDIIHGHSPHHLLKLEKYKKGFIFYSLGDFIEDYAIDIEYRNDLACLAELNVWKSKETNQVELRLKKIHPTVIRRLQVNLATRSSEKKFIREKLELTK